MSGGQQAETDKTMRVVANLLEDFFNPQAQRGEPKKLAFMLLVAPFGQPEGDVRTNYVGNCMRPDAMEMLTNLLDRWKAAPIAMQNPDHDKKADPI